VSFLPQLRGEKGAPRESIYMWYSPRMKDDMVRECAFDHRYKLYKNGDFFSLTQDIDEKKPMKVSELQGDAAAAAVKLQKALDRFKGARPEELDKIFAETGAPNPRNPNAKGKGKNKGKGQGKKNEEAAAAAPATNS
jgi:arylsulfatase A